MVSALIANYNGAVFLADAIKSVQTQSLRDIEIIISDDASSDDSVRIAAELMKQDARIRLIQSEQNQGPGAARNRALAQARGEWIAVIDSDDLIHPDRLAKLLDLALRDQADIVADDVLEFDTEHVRPPRALLSGRWARAPFWVEIADYVRLNHFYGAGPALGYLKPIARAAVLRKCNIRYDENLQIGEDYHFVLRMLRVGLRMRVYPLLLYFYRRHHNSTSHRLNEKALLALKEAEMKLRANEELSAVLKRRMASIDTALQFQRLLASIKSRNWLEMTGIAFVRPQALALLRLPLAARSRRLFRPHRTSARSFDRLQVCVLSRQRVVGRTNGSSTYLLDLAEAVGSRGVDLNFVAPSPATLGRWPYLRLLDDLSIFRYYRVRGTWRRGRILISLDPRRFIRGGLGLLDQVLVRTGMTTRHYFKRDPYSIAQPLTREDQLFIARHVPRIGDFLIADYCFLTECFPYALRPDARTAVIMHDRFSSRPNQFDALGAEDSVSSLTEDEECRRLALADSIVAIQADEGDWVRRRIPNREVIVAPMAADPVKSPQQGRDDLVLFVGSLTEPNVDGVTWFLEACWPLIRKRRPDAILQVAGSVCRVLGPPPKGVKFLGFVNELGPLYQEAGLVVSPLRVGSGLKIKLIEALSHGKAMVATSRTLQGVENLLADSLRIEDAPEAFAAAVLELLGDRSERLGLASRALAVLALHFSPQACYSALLDRIVGLQPTPLSKSTAAWNKLNT
jgi:succinoglycan biosynthesis protein ExoO